MVYATVKIKKWGHSLGITIPKHAAKDADLSEEDIVNVHIIKKVKVSGFGICKGKPAFEKEHDRTPY